MCFACLEVYNIHAIIAHPKILFCRNVKMHHFNKFYGFVKTNSETVRVEHMILNCNIILEKYHVFNDLEILQLETCKCFTDGCICNVMDKDNCKKN
jgi:hypothetical protein